jgi:hypothetical protein
MKYYIVKHYKAKSKKDIGRCIGAITLETVKFVANKDMKEDAKCYSVSIYQDSLNGKRFITSIFKGEKDER